jgi:mono/diheme cytochrome c family protein
VIAHGCGECHTADARLVAAAPANATAIGAAASASAATSLT